MRKEATLTASTAALLVLSSCEGGINAGERGGLAFIAFTAMLLLTVVILWLAVGRHD